MKKFLASLLVLGIAAPVFAINEYPKMSRKCRKHPEKCQVQMVTPIQEQQMTLVTQDADGLETWIYDKVSSITAYNSSGFGVGVGGLGGGYGSGGFGGGLANVGYNKNGGTVQSVQKTLTVVIKFDDNHNVKSFSYHMSTF